MQDFLVPSNGCSAIIHFIPRKACLIRPHSICQELWLDLYLVHDNVAPCLTSSPIQQCPVRCWSVDEQLIHLGFSKHDFLRGQFSLISRMLLFWYVRTYNTSFGYTCPTLAGLLDRSSRLVIQPVSIKRFTTFTMVLCERCEHTGKRWRYSCTANRALRPH